MRWHLVFVLAIGLCAGTSTSAVQDEGGGGGGDGEFEGDFAGGPSFGDDVDVDDIVEEVGSYGSSDPVEDEADPLAADGPSAEDEEISEESDSAFGEGDGDTGFLED